MANPLAQEGYYEMTIWEGINAQAFSVLLWTDKNPPYRHFPTSKVKVY